MAAFIFEQFVIRSILYSVMRIKREIFNVLCDLIVQIKSISVKNRLSFTANEINYAN